MKKILVDTSAWVEYFRGSKEVAKIVHDKNLYLACITGPIITELIQGLKTESEKDVLASGLGSIPRLSINDQDWIDAGRKGAALRKKGITVPLADLIIYTLAFKNNCSIYTADKHFQMIKDATGENIDIIYL